MSLEGNAAAPWRPWGFLRRRLARLGVSGRSLVIAPPMLWLLLFFLIPFLVVLKIALSEPTLASPPYAAMFAFTADGHFDISLALGNFQFLLGDPLYLAAYLSSIQIAFLSTLITLIVAYPMAYAIARAPSRWRNLMLMLVILPFWTSFLLRVYAWIGILKGNGVINNILMGLGLIHEPLALLHSDFAVYVGIVYTYLPFMILPLYANLAKLDEAMLEASADLGARPVMTFLTVTLPLSMPGVLAGAALVFIPVVGEFVIPELLGGPSTLMIGRVLWNEFFLNRDWPMASSVAIVMLIVLVVPLMIAQKVQSDMVDKK